MPARLITPWEIGAVLQEHRRRPEDRRLREALCIDEPNCAVCGGRLLMSDCEDCGLDIPPCRDVFAVGRRIWHREARRTQEVVVGDDKQKKDWVKVVAPQRWRPTKPGATLEGVFISKSTRPGDNGTVYGVVTVSTKAGTFAVAGAVISSLFEAAGCSPGTSVRIVFLGDRTSASGRWYRDYDLFLAKEEFGA